MIKAEWTNADALGLQPTCVSRQAAIDALCSVCGADCDKSEFVYGGKQEEQVIICPEHYVLTQLPSTQPERKKGQWIWDGDCFICSKCKSAFNWWARSQCSNFCPNCGADMMSERRI